MPAAENLEPGLRFGHYELRERLGQDPFCTAWYALHVVRKFTVELRVVRGFLARRTAPPRVNLLTNFTHPNLLEVLDVCANIAMPHVVYRPASGERLDDALVRGPMGWESVAELADSLLAALDALHESGNCLGRLSPDLVVLSDDGFVRLDGAGVQALVSDEYQTLLSSQDPLACAQHYLTPQGDLWSLGALTWCALTARMPPLGTLPGLSEVAPGAPPELAQFIARCRGESEAGPYESAAEARLDLAPLLAPPEPLVFPADAPPTEAPAGEKGPAPGTGPTAKSEVLAVGQLSGEALETMAARLRAVEAEIAQRPTRWPQGEAQAEALRETIGHAHLRVLEGSQAPARVSRHGFLPAVQRLLIPLGMVAVMSLVAFRLLDSLAGDEAMPWGGRCAMGAAVFGGTAVVAAWLVVTLGIQRLWSLSVVEVTPDEVIVRRAKGREVTDRIPARLLARVEVISPPGEGQSGGTFRLMTREGPNYTLRFEGARAAREGSQAEADD